MKKFRGLGFLIFIAVFAVASVVVMLLWNIVAVHLFNVPEIGFWYSAGLIILCKLLFGGFGKAMHGFGHHHHGNHRRCGHGMRPGCSNGKKGRDGFDERMDMLREMHEDFHSMSGRERREYIRRHMAHGFGDFPGRKGPAEGSSSPERPVREGNESSDE